MKKLFTLLFLFCVCVLTSCAQEISTSLNEEGGEYLVQKNDAVHPCITPQEYAIVEKQCAENRKLLGLDNSAERSTNSTSLAWPLKAATGFNDCSFYVITAYVDQNTAASAVQDWNCGTNTYDSHRGTDIAIFPYPFYKMDNNEVEVIAAAPGTILFKSDGNFDRNCASNALTANYIVVEHADGSQAHYWHMKMNSLTAKTVGQTVAAGEFLGVVGSSGSSTAPHLHFEVWSGSTVSTLVDPFSGTCNTLNANSWWASQKPYTEPSVIKVSTNITDIVIPACPTTETPNESASFTIPFQGPGLSPGYAKFYAFLRNEVSGMVGNFSILNPNGSTFNSWNYTSAGNYNASYRGWSKLLPTISGTYTFKAVYNGITCSQTFNITGTTSIAEQESSSAFRVYPNPSNGKFVIELNENTKAESIEIYNVLGAKVFQSEIQKQKTEINLTTPKGMYFYRIVGDGKVIATGKIVLE